MPELPEVEALAGYLRERAVGRRVERFEVAAISALKTYDPPPSVVAGRAVTGAGRHGKFLDVRFDEGLHLVVHLARAGWLHYREAFPSAAPLRPGKGPIAVRVRLDDGSGFDLTEAGTQKKLAAYLVTDPALVPGVGKLGPDALDADLATFASQLRSRRGQVKGVLTDQSVLAGIGNAYSDEILHAAKLSPADRRPARHAARGDPRGARRRGPALDGSAGRGAEGREALRAQGARPEGPTLPGLWRSRPGGLVRRFEPPVLSHLSDRWQAAG